MKTFGVLKRPSILLAVMVFLLAIGLAAYYAFDQPSQSATSLISQPAVQPSKEIAGRTDQDGQAQATKSGDDSILSHILGGDEGTDNAGQMNSLLRRAAMMALRLALAAILAAILAYRPHKSLQVSKRNPYVAETQVLLAVVAAALMMIVGDSAARAFGIFAAASLVRFRTNIRDPKEITVLLVSLAIGLGAGVGRLELAIILSLFVLLLLYLLECFESRQVLRAMELKVKTHDVDSTEATLRKLFDRHRLSAEVREINRQDEEEPLGKIVYYVNVSPSISTDSISEEIFSSDPHSVDSIEWHQKKSTSYAYR